MAVTVSENQARRDLIEIGRRAYGQGLIAGTEGNLSVRLRPDRILTTASGTAKGFLGPHDLVTVDLSGRVVGGRARASSELPLHLHCYRERADVGAIVHAHPPTTIAFSLVGGNLEQVVLPESLFALGPVKCVGYATPTTGEVVDAVRPYLATHNVLVLDRHGTVTLGDSLLAAYNRLESLEHTANILFRARQMGAVTPLPEDDLCRLFARVEALGIDTRGIPRPASCPVADSGQIAEITRQVLAALGTHLR